MTIRFYVLVILGIIFIVFFLYKYSNKIVYNAKFSEL